MITVFDMLCLYVISALAIAGILPMACAQCPDNPGFVTKANSSWIGGSETKESQTTSDNAEQICNLDENCLAFNSNGHYILKQPDTAATIAAAGIELQPSDGMCTYIKTGAVPFCPDIANYTTREFTNWVGSAKTQEARTTPENVEAICNLDPHCLAFNSFGYYLLLKFTDTPFSIVAANVSFYPFSHLCTYVKSSALPALIPEPISAFVKAKTFVFRNVAADQCFAASDAQKLPFMGLPHRLLASNCSDSDKSQKFQIGQVGVLSVITDSKDRCLTSYNGVLMKSAGFIKCASRADQLWALNSTTPDDIGPHLLQSNKTGTCIAIQRGAVVLDACNPRDTMMLFESVVN